jgi:NAD(P)-dependent dehydrogenase (short-subunit alcohol dehydrogenase family)
MTAGGFVVTGGTGALGRAVVLQLLARGDRVAVPYRGVAGWEGLQAAAGAHAVALWGAPADISDLDAARRFVDAAASWLSRLDGVACLAGGFAASGNLEVSPASEWDDMLRINLESVHATCRAALPWLLKEGGSVVTVGSRSAETAGGGMAAYAASKSAVLALTRALSLENRDRGVRFNTISPTTIDTEANRHAMPKADRSRWTSPEDIARVVGFLLSPASAATTGAVIPV